MNKVIWREIKLKERKRNGIEWNLYQKWGRKWNTTKIIQIKFKGMEWDGKEANLMWLKKVQQIEMRKLKAENRRSKSKEVNVTENQLNFF